MRMIDCVDCVDCVDWLHFEANCWYCEDSVKLPQDEAKMLQRRLDGCVEIDFSLVWHGMNLSR